jgi:hypothetical protein
MLLLVASLFACSTPEADPEVTPEAAVAEVVPVAEPVVPEPAPAPEVANLTPPSVSKLSEDARMVFGDQGFTITVAVFDTADAGTDGWRSCAKLTTAQFGIPDAMPHVFLTQNDKSCLDDPEGFVTKVLAADVARSTFQEPMVGTEKMAATSITVFPFAPLPAPADPASEPVTADAAK